MRSLDGEPKRNYLPDQACPVLSPGATIRSGAFSVSPCCSHTESLEIITSFTPSPFLELPKLNLLGGWFERLRAEEVISLA
jgi:hypothetical protein